MLQWHITHTLAKYLIVASVIVPISVRSVKKASSAMTMANVRLAQMSSTGTVKSAHVMTVVSGTSGTVTSKFVLLAQLNMGLGVLTAHSPRDALNAQKGHSL